MDDIVMVDFLAGEDEFGEIITPGFFSPADIVAVRQRGNDDSRSVVYLRGLAKPLVVKVEARDLLSMVTPKDEEE